MTEPICPPCTEGLHELCHIWVCSCTHTGCPDQLTIDDALNPKEPMKRFTPVTTDEGIAVRLESMLDDPWYLLDDDAHLRWSGLKNPRPYENLQENR